MNITHIPHQEKSRMCTDTLTCLRNMKIFTAQNVSREIFKIHVYAVCTCASKVYYYNYQMEINSDKFEDKHNSKF